MKEINEGQEAEQPDPRTVLEWYDFICPFCYIGQHRSAILLRHGLHVSQLPLQAHPEIPPGGIPAGPRNGPMYMMLEHEARQAGLPLNWPQHLPHTLPALAVAEWVRRNHPGAFPQLHQALFRAHFVVGEDLEDPVVLDRHASQVGINLALLHAALEDGSGVAAIREVEMGARRYGVTGTPTWLFGQQLIVGLRAATEFERLAKDAMTSTLHVE